MTDLVERLRAALGGSHAIERELGGGGMSRVFVAEDRALARPVVIKVLHPELAAGVNVDRFKREVQLRDARDEARAALQRLDADGRLRGELTRP